MAEEDRVVTPPEESSTDVFAFWDIPGSSRKVIYSLPVFHEIDFAVNEGYRKIPHGGIEVAGLLFGSITSDAVRIEAFRPIECEHASGPSLNFSERDLTALAHQLKYAEADPELKKFTTVGWFLAHTRSGLELSETEVGLFNRYFPASGQLTVLVKPERYQPTRFRFLVRTESEVLQDAAILPVILPLPGRTSKAGQMVPSLLAPKMATPIKRPARNDNWNNNPAEREVPEAMPESASNESNSAKPNSTERLSSDLAEDYQSSEKLPPRQFSRDRSRVMEEAYSPQGIRAVPQISAPANALRMIPTAYDRYLPSPVEEVEPAGFFSAKSLTTLALAALLGCLVGYVGYLQLPSPVIPLDIIVADKNIIVSWPPEETRNSIYAAIRLDDGQPYPLSAKEKSSGQVSLSTAKDFKVEIIARNWIHDSRGILRYVSAPNGDGHVVLPGNDPPGGGKPKR